MDCLEEDLRHQSGFLELRPRELLYIKRIIEKLRLCVKVTFEIGFEGSFLPH